MKLAVRLWAMGLSRRAFRFSRENATKTEKYRSWETATATSLHRGNCP